MGKLRLYIVLLLIVHFSDSSVLHSQIQSSVFKNYSVIDGMDDKTIHCIFQDSKGWIWIGSDFGVIRFDGYEFTKFDLQSEKSKILANSLIRVIYEDSSDKIWIGTESQGLFLYNRNQYTLTHFYDSIISNNSVWDIEEDENKNLWIGTEHGLVYFNNETGQFKNYLSDVNADHGLGNDFIRSVLVDRSGKIWIGTNNGIDVLDTEKDRFRHYLQKRNFEDRKNEIWEIYEDKKGEIWIGTYLGGLLRYSTENDDFIKVTLDEQNVRSLTVRSIIQAPDGDYWIGTRGGFYQIDSLLTKTTVYLNNILDDNSLAHNSVLDLYIDKKGDLWVGTRNGISYLNFGKRAFSQLTSRVDQSPRLNSSEVYAFWEDENSNIWIGTESGGINILDRKTNTVKYLTTKDGLSNNCIKDICPDKNGDILIGTYLGGLNKYNRHTGKTTIYKNDPNNPASVSDNAIWAVFSDSKNRIWVGTSQGVDLFDTDKGTFEHFGERFGVSMVVSIFEDNNGTLWMFNGDLKSLISIDNDNQISRWPAKARVVQDDKWQNLWIGTLGNGLIKQDLQTDLSVVYTTEQGLCSNVIYGIINANNRFIWLSTNNGLSRFDIEKEEFKNYSTNDGLLNNQYNYGAFLKCSDGTLLFGGKKGVDFVYPQKLHENDYLPPVILTDFRIFNEQVPISTSTGKKKILANLVSETGEITVRYDQNMISFTFAALNYANSEKNQYKYKLEGFDKSWNEIGNQRVATYTNLDPGDYILKVIGTNSDNKFLSEGLSIQLKVLPPFYKTLAFRIIVVLVMLVIGYQVYVLIENREKLRHQLHFERQSARQVKELDMLKHQFFMNISHEIRTPLSLILGPLDNLLNNEFDKNAINSNLKIIKRNTENLSKLVNQLLDYRKLETGNVWLELKKGNFSVFVDETVKSFRNLAEDKNIKLEYNTTQQEVFTWFDSDKVEKILNNLLSNAIKYTNNGGRISISLSMIFIEDIHDASGFIPDIDLETIEHKQYIQIVVRDTGIGIPKNQLPKIFNRFKQIDNSDKSKGGVGIGLSLTKELVKIHKGFIKVDSVEGKGSKFTLLLPLKTEGPEQEKVIMEKPDAEELGDSQLQLQDLTDEEDFSEKLAAHRSIVLVADDNPDIREFVKLNFEPEYAVLEANNGREAWEKALETVPDLIIADIMMPVMDGTELCRRIKKDERTSHIPVLMLTALSAKEKQIEGIDAGAEDYITKPFDISLLRAKVDNILSIRKALRERYSKEFILKPKEIVLASPDEKFLRKVIQVIEKNIANPDLDIDFLSKHVGVSRTQLYRKIKALTDMAAKEFVKDMRLKRASQLLIQDKLNISEIAYEVGFSDMSYFRKCFKERYGASPSEYSKVNRGV